MKRFFRIAAAVAGAALFLLIAFLAVQSIRLRWWVDTANLALPELTADQKAADMAYLLDLTRRVTPAEVVWQAAGLDNPLDQPEAWIKRARQTQTNAGFADLVLQYLVHLGQGGHAFLAYDVHYNPTFSLIYGVPKTAFANMPRWAGVISRLAWNAHSDLDIAYQGGHYVLQQAAAVGQWALPAGSLVTSVDGSSTDEFVLQQQYRAHLRYDPQLGKFFLHPLLSVDPGPDRAGWDVTFRLPDQTEQTVFVRKIPGYVPHRPDESRAANIRCLSLQDGLLYVKINTFYREFVAEDNQTLRHCFASGQFQAAILDVRGNNGGEIWSYMDNLIAPLIDQPVTYQATVANRESFYAWHGWRFWLYAWENDNQLTDPRAHVQQVEEIAYPPYSEQGWRVLRVTRRIEPSAQPFSFDGQVYVLADNNALSAADSFAAVMKQTRLAKVIGANTAGWGQAAQAKMLYSLPNSGLLFYVDSELIFNPDGSLDNYTGVAPDVFLDPSSYPTPYPLAFDRETLLADRWVQWVISDAANNP